MTIKTVSSNVTKVSVFCLTIVILIFITNVTKASEIEIKHRITERNKVMEEYVVDY